MTASPRPATRMAATRAANDWLAVHILGAMAALRKPASAEAVAIERRVTQAERRLHLSLKSVAVLRRLRKPMKPEKFKGHRTSRVTRVAPS